VTLGPSESQTVADKLNRWSLIFADGLLGLLGITTLACALAIARRPVQHDRVFLVVDDLDRCEPTQMLAVIESLRLFLDEPEMSRRLQVAMLLDRNIFKRAITDKGRRARMLADFNKVALSRFFRDQEEKFFVASLELPPLVSKDISELAARIVDQEQAGQAEAKRLDSREATEKRSDPGSSQEKVPTVTKETGRMPAESSVSAASGGAATATERADITFNDEERDLLKKALVAVESAQLTPRSVRAFVLRYQLVRLVLRHVKQEFTPSEILEVLVSRWFPSPKVKTRALSPVVLGAIEMVTGRDEPTKGEGT